jgi:hypothetical protein
MILFSRNFTIGVLEKESELLFERLSQLHPPIFACRHNWLKLIVPFRLL